MTTFTRYLVLQIPGWAVAAVLLRIFWPITGLDAALGVMLFAGWVVKDLVVYPFLRIGYAPSARTGAEQLVGMHGVVSRTVIARRGWVRLRGERWRAELAAGEAPIPEGTTVRVVRVVGLTLVVARSDESEGA